MKKVKSKSPIETVKQKLWTFGYSIKDCSYISDLPYDLLITNKQDGNSFRVKVYSKNMKKIPSGCDLIANVKDGEVVYVIVKKDKQISSYVSLHSSPLKVFGRPIRFIK